MRFYVLFSSFSVILGRWVGDNESRCTIEPRLRLKRFTPLARLEPGTARSVASALPTELPGLLRLPESGREKREMTGERKDVQTATTRTYRKHS